MEQLQKHKFYAILVGVLLLYIIFYFFFVSSTADDAKDDLRSLVRAKKQVKRMLKTSGLPNDQLLVKYGQRKMLVKANVEKMQKLLEEKDAYLEQWFEGLDTKTSDGMPEIRKFHRYYFDRRDELIDSYRDSKTFKIVDEEDEHTIEEILPFAEDKLEINTKEMMKIKQKEFWIIKGILEIVKEGRLKTLSSFADIKYNYQKRRGQEKKKRLFATHLVEFSGTIDYEDIPYLMETMLKGKTISEKDPTPRQNMMLEITGLEVKRRNDYIPSEVTVMIPYDVEDIKGALDKYRREHREELRRDLPPVIVTIKCRVLDYERQPSSE